MRAITLFLSILHLGCATGDGLHFKNNAILEDSEPNPPLESVPDASQQDAITRNFLSATLGSNMVLQRDVEAILWGYTQPGASVTTSLHEEGEMEGVLLTTTAQEDDGLWRQPLPPHPATLTPTSISIKSTTGEKTKLDNVLFGDVYLCGGQSNMVFSLPGTTNGTAEAERGEDYKHIRLFTVGQGTQSSTPLPDLQTVEQNWTEAGKSSLYNEKGVTMSYFSSVCWFFGREISDGLENKVPIGLISNNWGGTQVEKWLPNGVLCNAMIHPYTIGPMSLTGFTWYQGEANAGGQEAADAYAKKFPKMIEAWREAFQVPDGYFGFVQLSTWCPEKQPLNVPELRQAQMAALTLGGKTGYATNADHGDGCNIHPPPKQYCGARLGKSALALQYGKQIQWKSPSYSGEAESQTQSDQASPSIVIELNDVSSKGLYILDTPYNLQTTDPFSCDNKTEGTCVGAMVLLNGKGWVKASVSLEGKDRVKLTAAGGDSSDPILATSYGWGAVPLMTVYDAGTDLPLLPWNEQL